MTELIGDVCIPSQFIVPVLHTQSGSLTSGSLMKSGSALSYISGSKLWTINATET